MLPSVLLPLLPPLSAPSYSFLTSFFPLSTTRLVAAFAIVALINSIICLGVCRSPPPSPSLYLSFSRFLWLSALSLSVLSHPLGKHSSSLLPFSRVCHNKHRFVCSADVSVHVHVVFVFGFSSAAPPPRRISKSKAQLRWLHRQQQQQQLSNIFSVFAFAFVLLFNGLREGSDDRSWERRRCCNRRESQTKQSPKQIDPLVARQSKLAVPRTAAIAVGKSHKKRRERSEEEVEQQRKLKMEEPPIRLCCMWVHPTTVQISSQLCALNLKMRW